MKGQAKKDKKIGGGWVEFVINQDFTHTHTQKAIYLFIGLQPLLCPHLYLHFKSKKLNKIITTLTLQISKHNPLPQKKALLNMKKLVYGPLFGLYEIHVLKLFELQPSKLISIFSWWYDTLWNNFNEIHSH